MFSIIDRYIAKNFLIYFGLSLSVFVMLFVAVDYLSTMSTYPVAGDVLLRYYAYSVPEIIYQLFPTASVVAGIFTISSLNKNSELIALFSMGHSLARISAPLLILSALLGGVAFVASDRLLPNFEEKKDYTYWVEVRERPGMFSTVKTDRIWYRSGNILFNIKSLNTKDKSAQGASFYYFDNRWNMMQTIFADKVKMDGQNWLLTNGYVHLFTDNSSFPMIQSFDEKLIQIEEDIGDIQTDSNSANRLELKELKRFIDRNKDAGIDVLNFEVSYHSKFAYAFTGFILVLLGIPFSVKRERSGSVIANIGICVGLVFLFWGLYGSFLTLAKYGNIPPIVGAWAANFLLFFLSVYLIGKTRF